MAFALSLSSCWDSDCFLLALLINTSSIWKSSFVLSAACERKSKLKTEKMKNYEKKRLGVLIFQLSLKTTYYWVTEISLLMALNK